MGLFPPLPGDEGPAADGPGPTESMYEWWVRHVCELYPEAATVEEAVEMLAAEATEILKDVTPYTWGQATETEEIGDPVEWAEEVTRQAVESYGVKPTQIGPVHPKRLEALRRAETWTRVSATRKALNGLLRAAKALRRALS